MLLCLSIASGSFCATTADMGNCDRDRTIWPTKPKILSGSLSLPTPALGLKQDLSV